MGVDAHAPSITLVDPETGKGRVTYLCEGRPERAFLPTPGMWFSNQPEEARSGARAAGGAVTTHQAHPHATPGVQQAARRVPARAVPLG